MLLDITIFSILSGKACLVSFLATCTYTGCGLILERRGLHIEQYFLALLAFVVKTEKSWFPTLFCVFLLPQLSDQCWFLFYCNLDGMGRDILRRGGSWWILVERGGTTLTIWTMEAYGEPWNNTFFVHMKKD